MLGSITIQSVDLAFYGDHLLDFVLRLLAAALAGFIIGFERKSRSKEAGVRTHTLVAVGSAIMMILSKYAFGDMIINELGVRGADGARIAAQVVSGIGFLGAGIIVYRRDTLRGLTTAAGIWATAGLGMAFGSGMYIVGAVGTVVILGIQNHIALAYQSIPHPHVYDRARRYPLGQRRGLGQGQRDIRRGKIPQVQDHQDHGYHSGRRGNTYQHPVYGGRFVSTHARISLYHQRRASRRNLVSIHFWENCPICVAI